MLDSAETPTPQDDQVFAFSREIVDKAHSPRRSFEGGHNLSTQQREFAHAYVMTGNATKAAEIAGYRWPARCGNRNLCNPSIGDYIRKLCVVNMQAHLPKMLEHLVQIATDPQVDAKARVSAITVFLDRAGLKPKAEGPAVNVQVNIGGREATAAIAEVWQARTKRIAPPKLPDDEKLSDIDDTMTDTMGMDDATLDRLFDQAGGGDDSQGPVAVPDPIPVHPSPNEAD
jgi:phage terminase small subunit